MDYQVSDFLSPNQWEADTQPCGHAGYARQPDIIIIQHFLMNVKSFLLSNLRFPVYIPQAKAWGFDGGVLNTGNNSRFRSIRLGPGASLINLSN